MHANSPRSPGRRRCLWLGLCAGLASAHREAAGAEASEFWLDLSEPLPADARDTAQAQRVAAQQAQVAQRLRELGIDERARVVHVGNAILVRLTPEQARTVRSIPGVVRLRPARRLHPPERMSRSTTNG